MPFPQHDGGAYSLYITAMGLISQGINMKIFAVNTPKDLVDSDQIPDEFKRITGFEYSKVDTRIRFRSAFINLFTAESYFAERFFSKEFDSDLQRILSEEEFDIIQLEHLYLCLYLNTIRKYSKAKVILRPQNVENLVWKQICTNKTNPLTRIYLQIQTNRLRKFEVLMSGSVDGIMAISPNDFITFKNYAPNTPSANVPIGYNFSNIQSVDSSKPYMSYPVFYHLGSMDWLPNIQGMKWFIKKVMPFIIRSYPQFVFRIAGKKMPLWFHRRQNGNLIVDGEVKDSFIYQEDKSVMIVPLLAGGGLRAKIVEGMALGKTIISTSTGAEGIPFTDQKNILIANTKEEFVTQIKKCYDSKEFCQQIGLNAQILAREHYDYHKTAISMNQFYNRVSGGFDLVSEE
jgi:polysaccharide biosynthesis protein PslH